MLLPKELEIVWRRSVKDFLVYSEVNSTLLCESQHTLATGPCILLKISNADLYYNILHIIALHNNKRMDCGH